MSSSRSPTASSRCSFTSGSRCFGPQEWLWVDISQLRLSLVLALILLIPAVATGVLPNLTHPLSIGALLFVMSSLFAQAGAIDPATGWFWIDYLVRLIVVCLLAVSLITHRVDSSLCWR